VEEFESSLIYEFLSELVGLQEVHKSKGVGIQVDVGALLLLKEPVHELLSFDLAILIFVCSKLKDMMISLFYNKYYSISMAKM